MLGGAAVSWASKRQQTAALSSTEAEYMCACSGAQEITHIRGLMSELGFEPKQATMEWYPRSRGPSLDMYQMKSLVFSPI